MPTARKLDYSAQHCMREARVEPRPYLFYLARHFTRFIGQTKSRIDDAMTDGWVFGGRTGLGLICSNVHHSL